MGSQIPGGAVQGLIEGGKLILDDDRRVSKIYDRGESARFNRPTSTYCDHRTKVKPTRSNGAVNKQEIIDDIAAELDEAKVSYTLDPEKRFLPRNQFFKILTFDRVRIVVHHLKCFSSHRDKKELSGRIYYGSRDKKEAPCLKLLAILIGIDLADDMAEHMADGMSDACLPLKKESVGGHQHLKCRKHGQHRTINRYRRSEVRERFAQWSYSLSAPYIARAGNLHSHYVLETGDVFPMEVKSKVEQEDNTESTERGSQGNGDTYGGFSEVYKVKIHRAHFEFGDHGIRHPQGYFALKKLTSHNRLSFNLELSSLIFTGHQYHKKHLIQLLATFEVVNPATGSSTFYLLFDWAEGSLNKFWQNNTALVGDKRHCEWMATQFYEISEALQCVHNDRAPTLKYLEDRASNDELYGRHGDIKPGNFLWFHTSTLPGLIALSDFGLGRLHTQVSRSKQDPKNIERTATYRCPEFDLPFGQVSPRSDIFSLGCVMLEYVTWFLMGLDAVNQAFPEARNERDIYGFDSDVFFSIKDEKAFLKPSVAKWIRELQNHRNCSWYIWDLLNLIKDGMLDPNGSTRMPASLLTRKMKTLQATCLSDKSYYMGSRQGT